MTDELVTAAIGVIGGGTGLALARGVEYAIKRGSDAWRSRAEKRAQTEADAAKSTREREETTGAVAFMATEELIRTLRDAGPRLDRAERRLDECEFREKSCQEALIVAEARCKDAITRAVADVRRDMRSEVRGEVRRTLSPHGGTPKE